MSPNETSQQEHEILNRKKRSAVMEDKADDLEDEDSHGGEHNSRSKEKRQNQRKKHDKMKNEEVEQSNEEVNGLELSFKNSVYLYEERFA